MNRRDFFKWIGRLFAALPFVALADLEPKTESKNDKTIYGVSVMNNIWDDFAFWERLKEANMQNTDYYLFRLDKDDEMLSWELEVPREKAEYLSNILQQVEDSISPWQRFIELNEDDFDYRYIWKE